MSEQLVVPRRTRLRVGLGAAVVLLVVGLAIAVLVTALGSHGSTQSLGGGSGSAGASGGPSGSASGSATARAPASASASAGAVVYVHVLGAVAKPGLFELRDGARAVDAIAAAGGFTAEADQAQVNLARFVVDGEQINVPVVGAVPPAAGSGGGGSGASPVGGKVNLNTASLEQLESLPRVGPAMAKRILDWRTTNGRFTAVEDLMSVTGVGDKTFAQLKDLVTV